ncbi:hypothetical protein FRC00_004464 [Tulasnella sp. 408]|nr:hypothetical protein FRC00_004464 [Tulasnella sp. 408]
MSNFPIYPSSTALSPASAPLAHSSSRSQQSVPVPQAEAEVLDHRTRLTTTPRVQHAKAQEFRSRQAKDVIPHATSATQRRNNTVAGHQVAEEQHVPDVKASTRPQKQRIEGRNKWWEMGGNLRHTKRHFRREAVDFGNPNGPYCNSEQIADQSRALKRGRANKRRPQKHHLSKLPEASTAGVEDEPILPPGAEERVPLSTARNISTLHSQKRHSKLAVAIEGPHQPVGYSNVQPDPSQDATAHLPFSTARHPLGSLDINVVVNGGAQELHQMDLADDSEHGENSLHDTADQVPAPYASLWFGQRILSPDQNPDPNQL